MSRTRRTASASARGSSSGTSRASRPSARSSRRPRTAVATSGRAAASVSRTTIDSPSECEETTTTSAAPINSLASPRRPANTTRPATPNLCAARSRSSRSVPVPMITRAASGMERRARIARAWFFAATSRPTLRSSGQPDGRLHSRSSSERFAAGGAGETPFEMVAMAGAPLSSSASRIPCPHATMGNPASRRTRAVAGQSASGTPWTLTRPRGRRPRRVASDDTTAMPGLWQ